MIYQIDSHAANLPQDIQRLCQAAKLLQPFFTSPKTFIGDNKGTNIKFVYQFFHAGGNNFSRYNAQTFCEAVTVRASIETTFGTGDDAYSLIFPFCGDVAGNVFWKKVIHHHRIG